MGNGAYLLPLGELAQIRQGHPFRGAIAGVSGGDVQVIQLKDLTPAGLRDPAALLRTNLETRKEPDWVHDQDLAFVARGSSNYAALIAQPPPRTICSPHLYLITVRQPEVLLPAFLAWQLRQAPAQRYLRQSAEGSLQLSIRRTVLEQLQVCLLPLARQRAVLQLQQTADAERGHLEALIHNRETELAAIAERLLA